MSMIHGVVWREGADAVDVEYLCLGTRLLRKRRDSTRDLVFQSGAISRFPGWEQKRSYDVNASNIDRGCLLMPYTRCFNRDFTH